MLYSSTNFLNHKSVTQKFHLDTGLGNHFSQPGILWSCDLFSPAKYELNKILTLKELQRFIKQDNSKQADFMILESLKLSIWISEEKEKYCLTGDNRQMLLVGRTDVVRRAIIIFSFFQLQFSWFSYLNTSFTYFSAFIWIWILVLFSFKFCDSFKPVGTARQLF